MSEFDPVLSEAMGKWLQQESPPRGARGEVLRKAAALKVERWEQPSLPVRLRPWNLNAGEPRRAELWPLHWVARAVPTPPLSLRLML